MDINIIRKIRLSKIDCYTIKSDEKELFEFIEVNFFNLNIITLQQYPDYLIFLNDKNEHIFQGTIHKFLLYTKDLLWDQLGEKFGYNYLEINKLILNIVYKLYKIEFKKARSFLTPHITLI